MSHDIFISHASKDKALAEKLVDVLLSNGCDVTSDRILCTSLEGMGIPAGTNNFIEFLREKIQDPKLVILLLTENYFDSVFCVCELGATWGMGLKCFPITISPISKSNMPGTLKVAQAGDILDKSHLDELRDIVKDALETSGKTPRWTVKRDEFFKIAPPIIDALEKPVTIDKSKLDEAIANYETALDEVTGYSTENSELRAQIKDLEACKDTKEVRDVRRKYTDDNTEFKQLCDEAGLALENLSYASRACAFWYHRGQSWRPERDDWESVKSADAIDEITDNEDGSCDLNTDHPKAMRAVDKLNALQKFLDEKEMDDTSTLIEDLTEQHEITIKLTNKEFWHQFLVYV